LPRSRRNIRKPVPRSAPAPRTSGATPCAADGDTLAARFTAALDSLGSPLNAPFALAVSGGGDSVALMHLAAEWLSSRTAPLDRGAVLVVDHGLRPGSAREAAATTAWAKSLGFAAHTLAWRGPKPRSNIEDAARTQRYRLIGEWCRAHGVAAVLLAHTRDDQAETFLLRLGRGSGVDGLSAMRPRAPFPLPGYGDIALVRPLLDIGRDELRADLAQRGAPFFEDSMNEDPRFARVRIRALLPALDSAGITTRRIAEAAAHLARARAALDAATADVLARHARFTPDGAALLDAAALHAQPREIGLRALAAVLLRVSGQTHRPRFERLERLYDELGRSPGHTLAGCRIRPAPAQSRPFGAATLEIAREKPRRAPVPHGKVAAPAARPRETANAGAKLPKKRRIVGRLSGS
jgi:tRNA(Ile)-lysidine synthase